MLMCYPSCFKYPVAKWLHFCCYIVWGMEPRFFTNLSLHHWVLDDHLKSLLTYVASCKSMNFHVCPSKGQVSGQQTLTSERENLPKGLERAAERNLQQLSIIFHLVPPSSSWQTADMPDPLYSCFPSFLSLSLLECHIAKKKKAILDKFIPPLLPHWPHPVSNHDSSVLWQIRYETKIT